VFEEPRPFRYYVATDTNPSVTSPARDSNFTGDVPSIPIRSRPDPSASARAQAPEPRTTGRHPYILRNRRIRLYRLIERTQVTIAEIEDELRHRGVVLAGPPRRHGHPLPFRHNELPRIALNVLRARGGLCTSGRLWLRS
jgi:hypothetical protein